jgi:hypothetical protein
MPMQIFGVNEALGAVLARERILLGVLADLVVLEMLLAVEALAALAAREQRMVDVLSLVLLELVLARERHVALVAVERTEVGVAREQVALEVERGLECLAALVARLVLERLVFADVLGQLGARLERRGAELACEQLQVACVVRGEVVVK